VKDKTRKIAKKITLFYGPCGKFDAETSAKHKRFA